MLNRKEAMEVIDRLPYIRTFRAPSEKLLEACFEEALAKNDCIEWVKVIKTCYVRRTDPSNKGKLLTKREIELGEEAEACFQREISAALGIPVEKADEFIQQYLAENL